jgi:hypothetical protein
MRFTMFVSIKRAKSAVFVRAEGVGRERDGHGTPVRKDVNPVHTREGF